MIDPETGRRWSTDERMFGKSGNMEFPKEFWANLDRAQRRCGVLVPEVAGKVACALETGHAGKHRPPRKR